MGKCKKESYYRVIVVYKGDDGKPKFAGPYHNILYDRPESWKNSKAFFKRKYPTATHCNIYGGITKEFKKQEKFD